MLLDPLDAVTSRLRAVQVPTPALQPGEEKFDSGEFGAVTWYLMLAARLTPQSALTAADGWGGDAFVGYRSQGRTCARMTFTGKTPADTARMTDALQEWAASSSTAHVTTAAGRVSVESCDPGTGVRSGNDDSDAAIDVVTVRTSLAIGLVRRGLPGSTADCMADRMVQAFSVTSLVDPSFGADDPAVAADVQQIALACR